MIIWSIGNEDPLTAIHLAVIRAVKGADPTRPVLMPWRADEHLPPEIDILAPHYRSAADYDQMAAHSARPVLTTEYTHALGEQGFGGLEDRWRALTRHAAGAGGAIWMWQDQGLLINRASCCQDQRGSDGIVNADRTPQRDYWETKAVYAPVWVPAQIAVQPGQARVSVPGAERLRFPEPGDRADPLESHGGRPPACGGRRARGGGAAHRRRPGAAAGGSRRLRPPGVPAAGRLGDRHPRRGIRRRQPARRLRRRRRRSASLKARPSGWPGGNSTPLPRSRSTCASPSGARCMTSSSAFTSAAGASGPTFPDLDRYATKVRKWNVTEDPHGVRIEAEADHSVDDRNAFSASYEYRIGPDGALAVRYTVRPRIEPAWLPEIGFELAAPGLDQFRWLGLGPLDGYPNEKAAPIFGLWTDPAGTKAGVRWAEVSGKTGGFRVTGGPYVRFENGRLRVLSAVAGRPDKTRRADAEYRLDVKPGRSFRAGSRLRGSARVPVICSGALLRPAVPPLTSMLECLSATI